MATPFNPNSKCILSRGYRPLLFESLLRNYDQPQPCKHISLSKPMSVKALPSPSSCFKVDLSKKMRVNHFQLKKLEQNKENIDRNGSYEPSKYLHETNKMSPQSQNCSPLVLDNENINEFISRQHEQPINQHLAQPQKIDDFCLDRQSAEKVAPTFEQPDQIQQPKTLDNRISSIEVTLEDQKQNVDEHYSQKLIEHNPLTVVSQESENKMNQASRYQIKNKISVRILKKKMKSHSLEEIVDDLVKHRKIIINNRSSGPEELNVAEALLSFVRNQLLQ